MPTQVQELPCSVFNPCEGIVVSATDMESAKRAHDAAERLFSWWREAEPGKSWAPVVSMVTSVVCSPVNGYCSFSIISGGFVEFKGILKDFGIPMRNRFKSAKEDFITYLQEMNKEQGHTLVYWLES